MVKSVVTSSDGQTLINTGFQNSIALTQGSQGGDGSVSGAACATNAVQVKAVSDVTATANTPSWASALLFMMFLLVLLVCIGVFLSSFKQFEFSKGVYTAMRKSTASAKAAVSSLPSPAVSSLPSSS